MHACDAALRVFAFDHLHRTKVTTFCASHFLRAEFLEEAESEPTPAARLDLRKLWKESDAQFEVNRKFP
jgi:hypothetical protein